MNYDLKDTVCVITGAARGIGFAIAEAFAGQGAIAVVIDLRKEDVDNAVHNLASKGYAAAGYVGNVTDSSGMEAVFNLIMENHGP